MSAAELSGTETLVASPRPAVRTGRGVPGRFLRSELVLMFGRRRNIAGLGVLAVVPIIMAIAIRASGDDSGGPPFIAGIFGNGLFVALAALTIELPFFLPLAVAAVSGDSIAGEANLGTLRYLLTVPVGRTRLLVNKLAAVVIFIGAAVLLVAVVGSVIGVALFGAGDMATLSGVRISFGEGLWRILLVCAYLTAGLGALGAIGLFVSTLTEQPLGATIAVVLVDVMMLILGQIPQVDWMHPYLLTTWFTQFADLLRAPMAFAGVGRGLITFAVYGLVFWLAAWARFAGKDVSS